MPGLFSLLRSMPQWSVFSGEMREADCCRVPAAAGPPLQYSTPAIVR
jgi:hypothetical protein